MGKDDAASAERSPQKQSDAFAKVYLPAVLEVRNQLFEIERVFRGEASDNSLRRNVRRINGALESILRQAGGEDFELLVEDPTGQRYDETRTDCDASISGDPGAKLTINETLKPIVRLRTATRMTIVQKAVVLVDAPAEPTPTYAPPDNQPDAP